MNLIGERIQNFRKNKQLSLSELSERAGIAKSYLSSIERGIQSNPSIQFLEKIGVVLGISVEEFLQEDSSHSGAKDQITQEWILLVKEAMDSGVSKEEFKQFLNSAKMNNRRN